MKLCELCGDVVPDMVDTPVCPACVEEGLGLAYTALDFETDTSDPWGMQSTSEDALYQEETTEETLNPELEEPSYEEEEFI